MGIDTPKGESNDLNSLMKNLSDKEKDELLKTLKKEKQEREALIIKKLEEKYKTVRKLGENVFLVKNDNELRILIDSKGSEIYKGLKFNGRFIDKDNNQFLRIANKMLEPIISEEGEIMFKDCSTGKIADIEYLQILATSKDVIENLKKRFKKIEKSLIFSDIYYVKKAGNPLWFIVDSNGHEFDNIPGFIEYEENTDGIRVKRKGGKGLKANWTRILRDEPYKIIKEPLGFGFESDISIIEKKGADNEDKEMFIVDEHGKEVGLPGFNEYKMDAGSLVIKVATDDGYKRYRVLEDPRRIERDPRFDNQ